MARILSAETRKLVLAAARKYHYRPNLAAQQLRSAKSNSLGLVIPDTFQALSEPVVVRTIQALASFAAKQGMIFTVLSTAAFTEPGARMHLPDGIFVWGDVAADTLKGRLPKGHPMLVLDPNHPSYARDATPSIGPDNAGGAAALVRHLLARGAKQVRPGTTFTAMDRAVMNNHIEVVKLLLAAPGASDALKTKHDGSTPLKDAIDFGFAEIVVLLRAAGAPEE